MVIEVEDFNLRHTIESGQCFEWEEYKEGYAGVIDDTFIYIKQDKNTLFIEAYKKDKAVPDASRIKMIRHYFGFDVDYKYILEKISVDPYIKEAIKTYHGIRLVKQPHFSCLISFMLSVNTTVKNTKAARSLISTKYGSLVYKDPKTKKEFYSFPTIKQLSQATEEDLRACKTGFRAKYIAAAIQTITDPFLQKLDTMSYEDAKHSLMELKGIGEKVADCVLLYSYKFDNIYPTDTWVKQFTRTLYLKGEKVSESDIRQFGMQHFNGYAGLAQLFFFIYFREKNPSLFDTVITAR